MEILSKRLVELRNSKKYTQEKLGSLINVNKSAICRFEKGNRIPPLEDLIALSEIFQVSLDYLVGNDSFVIAEDNEHYGIKMSKEEIRFIKLIRNNSRLYSDMINNPDNFVDRMKLKL